MNEHNKENKSLMAFFKTALPVAAALVLFLLSAGFIGYRIINTRQYNERWKDYDECGLS